MISLLLRLIYGLAFSGLEQVFFQPFLHTPHTHSKIKDVLETLFIQIKIRSPKQTHPLTLIQLLTIRLLFSVQYLIGL